MMYYMSPYVTKRRPLTAAELIHSRAQCISAGWCLCGRLVEPGCVRLERSYSRLLQYDDMRFAQNELERNRIT